MATIPRPHLRRLLLLSLVLPALAAANPPKAHDRYQVIELGALGAAVSYANALNDSAVVVGNVLYPDGHLQAFIWDSSHGMRRVDPAARQSVANAINPSGIVAGAAEDDNRLVDAVIWPSIGQRISIAWAPFGAVATGINRKGEVVGFRMDGIFDIIDRAFSWPARDPDFAWNELFDDGNDSFATGINNKGDIVGSVNREAFVIDGARQPRILDGHPDSGPPATAVAINNHGDVVISELGQGFLVDGKSQISITYSAPVFPLAINDGGEVVGYVNNGTRDAFVWDKQSGVQLINDLIDTPGWQIFSANAINKRGLIAGFGVKNGRRRAVLLIPVKAPPPAPAP